MTNDQMTNVKCQMLRASCIIQKEPEVFDKRKDKVMRRRPDAGWKFEGRIRPRDLSTVFQRTRSLLPLGSELIGPGNSYWLLTNPPEGQQGSLVDVVVHLQSSPLQSILF